MDPNPVARHPGLNRHNRAARRRALKYNLKDIKGQGFDWQRYADEYKPTIMPIDLGIQAYKKLYGTNAKRMLHYKAEMWKAFREVR